MTALFIHGFASSGQSSKVDQLRRILGDEVLAPSLRHRPKADLDALAELVARRQVRTAVGSSMGGFYALALAQRFDLRLVLINPALRADETTRRYLGTNTVYDTGATFEWTERELAELCEIGVTVEQALDPARSRVSWKNVLALLAEHDDLIDARETAARLPVGCVVFDAVADHRFADLMPYAERIRAVAGV